MPDTSSPSLYEQLLGNFTGGLDLHQVSDENQVILSVLDNMQRILNCRAGTLSHLPDYGLPDMSKFCRVAGQRAFAADHAVRHLAEVRAASEKFAGDSVATDHTRSSGIRH